jgi:hypothetical protein
MTESKHCADHSRQWPLQALHTGFSTARPVGSVFQELIPVHLSYCLKKWHFDDNFYLAVFEIIFVNVVTTLIVIL